MNPPVPFRVCIPSRGARVGIATTGYRHLREVLRQKYAVSGEFSLQLDDGTEVCDEEYLKLLEPHTSLTVVEQELTRSAGGNLVALAGSSLPTPAPPQTASTLRQQQHVLFGCPHQPQQSYVIAHLPPASHTRNITQRQQVPGTLPVPMSSKVPQRNAVETSDPQGSNGVFTQTRPIFNHSPIPGIQTRPPLSGGSNVQIRPEQPSTSGASAMSSASLVSQLQIANVMGNVPMSPSPTKVPERGLGLLPQPAPIPAQIHNPSILSQPAMSSTVPTPIHNQSMAPQPTTLFATPTNHFVQPSNSPLAPNQSLPQLTPTFRVSTRRPCRVSPAYNLPFQAGPVHQHTYAPRAVPIQQYRIINSPYNSPCCAPPQPMLQPHLMRTTPSHYHHMMPTPMQLQHPQYWQAPSPDHTHRLPSLPLTDEVLQECQRDLAVLQSSMARLNHRKGLVEKQQQPPQAPGRQFHPPVVSTTSLDTSGITHISSSSLSSSRISPQARRHEKAPSVTARTIEWVENSRFTDSQNSPESSLTQSSSSNTLSSSGVQSIDTSGLLGTLSDSPLSIFPDNLPIPPLTLGESVAQEPEKTAEARVRVVSCTSDNTLLPDSSDCEEDDDKLCIIEQAFSPAPEPPLPDLAPDQGSISTGNSRPKPTKLHLVPFEEASLPQSLGDSKYPIIVDMDTVQGGSERATIDTSLLDEGYSSSSSPYDTAPQDFTSQLPFADYDRATTGSNVDPGKPSEEGISGEMLADVYTDKKVEPNQQMDLDEAAEESHEVDTDAEEEDFEEDFVMDVDVFSPLTTAPVVRCKQPPPPLIQPLLPDYLPLELTQQDGDHHHHHRHHEGAGVESAEEKASDGKYVVNIRRDSLSGGDYSPCSSPRLSSSSHGLTRTLSSSRCSTRTVSCSTSSIRSSRRLSSSSRTTLTIRGSPYKQAYTRRRGRPQRQHNSVGKRICSTAVRGVLMPRLIVRIPIHFDCNGDIRCEDCSTEDSDGPVTALEQLASKLEGESKREAWRVPRIVRLETQFSGNERPEPMTHDSDVKVAGYCSEIAVSSVCSVDDFSKCVRELGDLCCQSIDEEATTLEVGDEIELGEIPSPHSTCSEEMTGMELLNMEHCLSARPIVYHENPTEEVLPDAKTWKVDAMCHGTKVCDPRYRVQQYSVGGKPMFETICVGGRWHMATL